MRGSNPKNSADDLSALAIYAAEARKPGGFLPANPGTLPQRRTQRERMNEREPN